MPHYGPEELKEIVEVLEACSKEMELGASRHELEQFARKLLPHYGSDLFRLLWAIPGSMKGFPSASKIIERLGKGAIPSPKDHNFRETLEQVFGKPAAAQPPPAPTGGRGLTEELLERNTRELIREGVSPEDAKRGADFIRKIFPVVEKEPVVKPAVAEILRHENGPELLLELELDLELELEMPEEKKEETLDFTLEL